MISRRVVRVFVGVTLLLPQLALAQRASPVLPDRFLRGVPSAPQPGPAFALTLVDAVRRGLEHNLAVVWEEQQVKSAEGRRWTQLSELLPDVEGVVRETRQKVNLAAFGFTGFPGVPNVIGPFDVFDARVAVSQPLFDLSAIHHAREGAHNLTAARHTYQDIRNAIVLVISNLYLQGLTAESRLQAATVELSAAETLYQLAVDQKTAGVVAGIEVLRADVERKAAAQREIVARNEVARARIQLARAIGLPAAQEFSLSDRMPYSPAPAVDTAAVVAQALERREDIRTAEAKVAAAREAVQSAKSERLPSVHAQADFGDIGATVGTAQPTYALGAAVRVPIFDKGRTRARVLETGAELAQREAELADLRNGVSYDVQLAWRDLEAAAEQVNVAQSAVALALQALTQAQDRFRAGVASNIEVVQAQQAEAAARESEIASIYAHNIAKAALGRAMGLSEQEFMGFLGGQDGWQRKP